MARILIDSYNLALDKGTGVATYARNLSHQIKTMGHSVGVLYGNRAGSARDRLLQEIAFFDIHQRKPHRAVEIYRNVKHAVLGPLGQSAKKIPITGDVISRTFAARLPAFDTIFANHDVFNRASHAFKLWGALSQVSVPEKQDLAHWTYPLPLQLKGVPNIYTLHDIVPLRLPYTVLGNKRHYRELLKQLVRKGDHFITVSECSKRDLVEILGIAPERVTNTYQSVEIPAQFTDKPEEQVAREVEGVAGVGYKDYYLFWGSIEPKKNVGRLIEAYLASKVDSPLVIVGAQAWLSDGELKLINDDIIRFHRIDDGNVRTRKRVLQLSYLPFGLLVSLIKGAKAALFPSLYEGFGLPVLEAMLLGTPVICSNTASLPEVAGDAAIMIDPYDSSALAAAIRAVDADEDLRRQLSLRGLAQAARFSPELYRRRLESVYNRFL